MTHWLDQGSIEADRPWTDDPNHPKWDHPVGYSHAANVLALLDRITPSQATGSILTA